MDIDMIEHLIEGKTLGEKEKVFWWLYTGEKIIIKRIVGKGIKVINEFTNNQIESILTYIHNNKRVYLANSVSKLQDGTEKDGIGKYIFENVVADISSAQSASQLVSILYNANVLGYNGKKRNMEFWVITDDWKNNLMKMCVK